MISSASSISAGVGAPNDSPSPGGLAHRLDDRRVRVPEDHRAPGADEVDVAVAVGVGEPADPAADAMNRGVPPTDVKARTGEFTPPGISGAGALEQARRTRRRRGSRTRSDAAEVTTPVSQPGRGPARGPGVTRVAAHGGEPRPADAENIRQMPAMLVRSTITGRIAPTGSTRRSHERHQPEQVERAVSTVDA